MTAIRLLICLVAAVVALPVSGAVAADLVGKVTEIDGDVTAQGTDGNRRDLDDDADVFQGDLIATDDGSSVKIRFTDGTDFSISENAQLRIDEFVYDRNRLGGGMKASVLAGAFRFVTGRLARRDPDSVLVEIPIATIGIRGTHVAGEAKNRDAVVVLMEPEGGQRATAIQVSNSAGSVVIDEPGFGTTIADRNTAPSPPQRMAQETIRNLMRVMRSGGINFGIPRAPR